MQIFFNAKVLSVCCSIFKRAKQESTSLILSKRTHNHKVANFCFLKIHLFLCVPIIFQVLFIIKKRSFRGTTSLAFIFLKLFGNFTLQLKSSGNFHSFCWSFKSHIFFIHKSINGEEIFIFFIRDQLQFQNISFNTSIIK